jgi:hypothetical protein
VYDEEGVGMFEGIIIGFIAGALFGLVSASLFRASREDDWNE